MSNRLPDVRRFETADQLSRAAAAEFCLEADAAIRERGRFACAVAGGTTPTALYDLLAAPPFRDRIDWQKLDLYFGDERAVPPDDPASNFRTVDRHLLSRVAIPNARVHRIAAEGADLDTAASDYSAVVGANVAPADPSGAPSFDLILLGLGADGHTASLFPGSPALMETRRWFVASASPRPPVGRVTATLPLINAARHVFFLVAGSDKSAALAGVLTGPIDGPRLPAQLIAPRGRLVWFVDDAAVSQLKPAEGRVRA
jgi:6-phosphogluconolactonase